MLDLYENKFLKELREKKMGLNYSKEKSSFRVFSPANDKLILRIYDDSGSIIGTDYMMRKNEFGFFEKTLFGDLDGKFYTYVTEDKSEVTDPYSYGSAINSKKTAIFDLRDTDPEGFRDHKRPETSYRESIIYEMHIKDFTYSKTSGVKNRGKFLGVIEEGTKYKDIETGLDHLVDLGVTHVHLMPIYDFITVDEDIDSFHIDENYNWGYDPELYNVPEGSYSLDPKNPKSRVYELKKMIMELHNKGIRVIMDVVYNHLYRGKNSNFERLYPGYYLRRCPNGIFSNGSGCGTEMDTERPMYKKFILDSIEFWMKEYKIDGFRLDLMGLYDVDTVEEMTNLAKSIDKNALIYGEPWTGGMTTLEEHKRTLKGSQQNKGFSCFNDTFRDCIKGDNNGTSLGFVMGDFNKKICVETGIAGSINYDSLHIGFTKDPTESINYVNSHDDLILFDKINLALRSYTPDQKTDINKLAMGIIFTSFGIPFIHEGNEFLRTKENIPNTYNSPSSINAIDWSLKEKNLDFYNYMKDLISIRKELNLLTEYRRKDIRENLRFLDFKQQPIIGYLIKSNSDMYMIFHNASLKEVYIRPFEALAFIERNLNLYLDFVDVRLRKIFDKNGKIEDSETVYLNEIYVKELSSEIYRLEIKK